MTLLPATEALDYLLRQRETAWKLAAYHLDGLTTAECLWQPAPVRLHVRPTPDGRKRRGLNLKAAWQHQTAVTISRSRYAWFDGPYFGPLIICSMTSSEN